jgi:hypothetical protein
MSAIRPVLILVIIIAAILCAGCTRPAAEQKTAPTATAVPAAPEVNITVPFSPVPVFSQEGVNLAYEIELVPADSQALVPEKVEVLDPATGKVLYSADDELLAALYHPATVPPPTAEEILNGTGKLAIPRVSLWFTVRPDAVPDRLVHRLTLNRTAGGLPPVTVTGGEVAVRKDLAPVVIGSPMRGPGWLAMETTSPLTHHFSAQITVNGITRVPQRYAQDWIYVDPVTGQVASGNVSLAKNYFGYGKEIYSVADGAVVDVLDGLPDLETIFSPRTPTFATAGGNYVIVDIGDRKYACYAHMIPGSIRVNKGDTVKEGQLLGLMGNSGNSDLPHLHFQIVTDTPSLLGAEGYPHVYRSFDLIGGLNTTLGEQKSSVPNRLWAEFGDLVTFLPQPVPRHKMLMDNCDIVRLP